MKTLVSVLFVWFTIAWLDVRPCSGDDFPEEFKACSVYYNCGDLVGIGYPFWGNERRQFCGRQKFELKCKDNETTTMVINDQKFNVLNISQRENRMTIARSDLWEDYCPEYEIKTATLDERLFVYSSNDRNISVWYGCSGQRGVYDELTFGCGGAGGESSGKVNYAFEAEKGRGLRRECEVKIQVMITEKVLEEAKENRTALVEKGLREGFDVEYGNWYQAACQECNQTGGKCGGNSTSTSTYPFYCICANGRDMHPYFCHSPELKEFDGI